GPAAPWRPEISWWVWGCGKEVSGERPASRRESCLSPVGSSSRGTDRLGGGSAGAVSGASLPPAERGGWNRPQGAVLHRLAGGPGLEHTARWRAASGSAGAQLPCAGELPRAPAPAREPGRLARAVAVPAGPGDRRRLRAPDDAVGDALVPAHAHPVPDQLGEP